MSPDEELSSLDKEIIRLQKSTRTTVPALLPLHDVLRHKFRWYYNWSSFRFSRAFHVIFLLVFLLGIGGLFYKVLFYQPGQVQAATHDYLTSTPDGDLTQWTRVGADATCGVASNWCVAQNNDGDTSYVRIGTSGSTDLYNMANHGSENGVITGVTVYYVAKRGSTAGVITNASLKTGGTVYHDTAHPDTLTTSYALYNNPWATNPQTSAEWTWADIDSLQIGVRNTTAVNYAYVTQVYAQVAYNPGITVSGSIYQSGSESVLDNTAYTVYASVNNGAPRTATVPGNGTYSVTVAATAGQPIVVYIYNNANDANTFTVTDGSTNATGVNLYVGKVAVGNDNGGSTSNSAICTFTTYPSAAAPDDRLFSCSGNNLTIESGVELHILNSKSYTTSGLGTLTTQGTGGLHIDDNGDAGFASSGSQIGTTNISNAGGVTIDTGATVTVSGTMTLLVAGGWANNGTFSAGVNSGVTFNNTAYDQTVSGSSTTTFADLTLSNTGRTLNVNSNIASTSPDIITVNANTTLNLAAAVLVSGTGGITGSGTIKVTRLTADALATQYTISTKTLTNLTVDYTGTSAGGQALTNTTYGSAGAGGLKISGTLDSGTQTATVGGVFTVTGTYTPGASTITMNASSSIVNSGALTFSALTIAGAGVITGSNFTINGALTANNGAALTASGTSLITMATTGWSMVTTGTGTVTFIGLTISETPTSQSAPTININGTLTIAASKTFAPTGGTITMNNAAWAISLGASASLTFSGLTIAATPSIQPTVSFSIAAALTINAAQTLAPTAGTITMTGGSITNNNVLTFNNLTVTGTTTTSSNFTINGAANISGGNLSPSAGTITMATTGWTITNSGTLVFKGLTISETPSVQTSASFSVSGTLTVNAAKTFAPTAGTITMTSTGWGITNNNSLTFKGLTIAETPSTQPTASFSISGTLTVNATKTLAPTAGTITMTTTGWGIVNNNILTFSGLTIAETPSSQPTASFSVSGALTVNATKTLAPTAGTITMTGGSIVNNNVLTFNNLTVTGITTTSSDFAVNGTLNVSGGNLSPSAGTITLNNGSTITNSGTLVFNNVTLGGTVSSGSSFSVKADWTNNGTFNHSAGTVTLSGASGSTQIIGGSSGTTFQNLTATSAAARTIQFAGNSTTAVSGTWTVTGNSYPGGLIALQSTDLNNWTINPAAANVSYVDVSRSTNSGSAFCATFSNDGGNNNSWTISSSNSCAPGAPDGVTITSIETGQFTVGWNDNSGNETNFRVWISTSANDDCSLATYDVAATYTTAANVISQIASSLNVNNRYCAKVTSKNDTDESAAAYSLPKYTLANPPITPSHSAIATNSITWTWGKNSNPAWTEFYANDDSGINSGWVADASSWVATGGPKAANTQYTLTIKAKNGDGVEAPELPTVVQASAYTAIETPTTITPGLITPNSIAVNLSDTLTNLNVGSSGIQYAETSGNPGGGGEAAFTGWPQSGATTDAGLQGALSGAIGTTYSYKIKARNAEGVETVYSADFPFTTTAGTQLLYQLPGETLDENGSTHLLSYSDSTPDTVIAGVPFDLTIYAADGANYRDLAHTDTITLNSTDLVAEFPAAAAMTNGAITYSGVVMKTVGNQTISGTGSAGSSHEFVVVAGACSASVSTASAAPTSLDTGETSTVTINLKDAFGNNLAGHTVSTGSDQGGDNITFSDVATDVNGRIFAYVTSLSAHTSTLTVGDTTLGSLCTLDDHPQITFNEPSPPPATPPPSPPASPAPSPSSSPTSPPPPPPPADQPPSAPTNLRATDIGTTTIDLAWNASTDDVGVSGYELYNADTNIKIATTIAISYHLSGLSPDTTYRFYVKAFDTARQFSSNSNTLSVTTNKIEGPPEEKIVAFLVMSNLPDSINAGQEFPNNVRVSAADAGGKIIDTYNKAVFFSSSDKNARLAVDAGHMYTFTSSDAGIHEFSGNSFILNTGGKQKLTVSDYSTSSTMEIEVIAAPVVPSVVRDFFTNPENMSNVNTGVVTTTAAVLLIPFLINTAFSLGTLFPQIAYWFLQLLELIGVRKRRKSWGVIFNSQSGQAVPLAMVRIFDRQYNRVLEQVVTDDQGRYGFLVREGNFYIQASKSGYTFPSKEQSSSFYEKIYVGGDFKIAGKDQTVAFNIPMDPHTKPGFAMSLWIFMVKLNRLLQKLRLPLLLLGLIFAVIMIFVSYNIIYLLSLVFYVLLAVLEYLRTFKARPYGIVTDTYNHPLGMVIVRIYRKDNNRLLETDVTDSQGRFRFLVAPGVYYLVAAKPGYVDFKSHLMYLQKEKTQVSTTIKLKKEEK